MPASAKMEALRRLSTVARCRPSRRAFHRRGRRGDLGLPVAAKRRFMNLAVDDMDASVGARGQCRIMGNDHHGLTVVGDIAQDAEYLLGRSGVEISRRLVGDDDFGTIGERPRQRHAWPLTAGKLVGALAGL